MMDPEKGFPLCASNARDEQEERGIVSLDIPIGLCVYVLFIVKNGEKLCISNGVRKPAEINHSL